jgi:aspartyl-tRNA(Asn)/glutamyl-tRNA(Gln) amidotransferase subunit A
VADVAELMSVVAGPHHDDPDSANAPSGCAREPATLRIGWIEFPRTTAEVRRVTEQAWPVLVGQGHRVERIAVPFADPYPALVDILASAEAVGTEPEDEERCDHGRVRVARHGRSLTGASVLRAEQARLALRTKLRLVMDRYDILAMATVPEEPFGVDQIAPPWAANVDDLLWLAWSPASYPFNMTGQPAVSLPVGLTAAGLPVGLQLVGPVGGDCLVLSAASRIEADLSLRLMAPDQETEGQ